MLNESVGERFKEAREKHNWAQKELADKVGYSFNYISDVERGKRFPRLDRLINNPEHAGCFPKLYLVRRLE